MYGEPGKVILDSLFIPTQSLEQIKGLRVIADQNNFVIRMSVDVIQEPRNPSMMDLQPKSPQAQYHNSSGTYRSSTTNFPEREQSTYRLEPPFPYW